MSDTSNERHLNQAPGVRTSYISNTVMIRDNQASRVRIPDMSATNNDYVLIRHQV